MTRKDLVFLVIIILWSVGIFVVENFQVVHFGGMGVMLILITFQKLTPFGVWLEQKIKIK